jgi:putative inorganic carbon (hco3(-)) transporter
VPLAYYLLVTSKSWVPKTFLLVALGLLFYVNMLTVSRTGFLAISTALAVLLFHYQWKAKRYGQMIVFIALTAITLILFAPEHFGLRMLSIIDSSYDEVGAVKGATGSLASREWLMKRALEVSINNPLFGVGPGQFDEASGSWHAAHNTFLQFSGEAGVPGLAIFLLLLYRAFRNLKMLEAGSEISSEGWKLAGALRASVAAFCVGAMFTNFGYTFFPYFTMAFCASALECYRISTFAPNGNGRRIHSGQDLSKCAV